MTTSCLWESAPALGFPVIQRSCRFFEFLSVEFTACSEPPSRGNHRKASYPRTQQRDQGAGVPNDHVIQDLRKYDAYTYSAMLSLPNFCLPRFFQKSLSLCSATRFLSFLFGHSRLSKNIKNIQKTLQNKYKHLFPTHHSSFPGFMLSSNYCNPEKLI